MAPVHGQFSQGQSQAQLLGVPAAGAWPPDADADSDSDAGSP